MGGSPQLPLGEIHSLSLIPLYGGVADTKYLTGWLLFVFAVVTVVIHG
jgi:hypothetical protein